MANICLAVKVKIAEDQHEFFKKTMGSNIDKIRSLPGTLEYDWWQVPGEPRTYFFVEEYESQEAGKAHGAILRELGFNMETIFETPPEKIELRRLDVKGML